MMMKKMKQKLVISLLALGAVCMLGACGSNVSASSSVDNATNGSATKATTVRMGAVGQDNVFNENTAIAQQQGFLQEELENAGYDLEIIGFAQAGPAINEAFGAEEIDMAIYGDMPATVCKASGVDTTIFATNNSEMQMCIFVREGSDIKTAKDFVGKKIIVARGTIYHQCFKSWIADAGVDESELEQINTLADASSVIESGEADALITSTSIGYYMESQGLGKVVDTTVEHPEWTSQFLAVGRTEFLKANPEAAKAVVRALLRAYEWSKENSDQVPETIAALTQNYPEEIYAKVYNYNTTYQYFNPEISSEGMEKLKALEKFLEDEALITDSVDMDNFVDTSYYEEVIAK